MRAQWPRASTQFCSQASRCSSVRPLESPASMAAVSRSSRAAVNSVRGLCGGSAARRSALRIAWRASDRACRRWWDCEAYVVTTDPTDPPPTAATTRIGTHAGHRTWACRQLGPAFPLRLPGEAPRQRSWSRSAQLRRSATPPAGSRGASSPAWTWSRPGSWTLAHGSLAGLSQPPTCCRAGRSSPASARKHDRGQHRPRGKIRAP